MVAGPFNLVINQIPLPLGLPFGFFPFPKRKEIGVSGILVPQYGEEPNGRGFYLRNGFSAIGPVFEEAGIPHQAMVRRLV